MHPAIWLAPDAPSVIIVQDTATDCDDASIHSILRHYELLQDRSTSQGRHLVLGDGKRHHRILFLHPCSAGRGYLVPQDRWVRSRLAAIDAFDRSYRQSNSARSNDLLSPSPHQRRRLTLLLNILDVMHRSDSGIATTREITKRVVYPNADLGRAIEWKSSSYRRQTQRLIKEARFLVEGGYRWLLKGLLRPRSPNP